MSEYQYYGFLAVDRPLTDQQIDEVRDISSRAELSSTRFVNEYHWGDFKGNPDAFVTKYYDLMIYVANWGTHRLLLGLPADAITVKLLKRYISGGETGLDVRKAGGRVILDLTSQMEDYEYEDFDSGEQSMDALAPVREDLLAGDLRPLFLSWLSSVWIGEEQGEGLEVEPEEGDTPPVPPGLAQLTKSQKALAEFLRVDQDLLAAAAELSLPLRPAANKIEDWITELPQREKDQMLLDLASGKEPHLAAKLVRRFRVDTSADAVDGPVLSLQKLVDRARELRDVRRNRAQAAAERARRKREAEAAAKREAHLMRLMRNEEKTWAQVEQILRLKQNKAYGAAVATLKDLREVASRKSALNAFASRVRRLREAHKAKYTFVEKLDEAKLV